MNRSRGTFFLIILAAVAVIIGYNFFNNRAPAPTPASGSQSNGQTNTQTEATPNNALVISVASSNTKQNWLTQVASKFNDAKLKTKEGSTIFVEVSHVTSGGSMNAILDGTSQPTAWSPGDGSWVEQANQTWQTRNNKPLASESCPSTIYAPLGFAMWRPMAEALGWPDTPIGWDDIVKLAADPNGWASYGRPEWGKFTFGHTHPAYANSGLLSMTSFVYGVAANSADLTVQEIYSDQVQNAMATLEQNTAKYGRQAPALLELMAKEGTSYLHAAAVPEADVVRFNIERGDELSLPLAFIFPKNGTIWAEHPYCILDNADWVSAEEAEAARIFRDYLLAKEQQELAIDNYLRPLDSSISLHEPMTLENGTDPRVSPATVRALPSPNAAISEAVIDIFKLNKRKATILIVFDVSGSMEGDRIRTARTATADFLRRLDANDEVGMIVFNDRLTLLEPPQRAGDVTESLASRVSGLVADGATNLYGAVCQATSLISQLQQEDEAAGEKRLYGVVLLSDGEDTVESLTENQMFATCLPSQAEADGVKIYPIAFGEGADQDVLSRIAKVTAGQLFTADPSSISNIYLSISAEQ
ncbi:MAG: VWA domain-containing protein [Trueperaceae bacterium]|nr:VWA domain-containing protein [Trueperaceae bacterium]